MSEVDEVKQALDSIQSEVGEFIKSSNEETEKHGKLGAKNSDLLKNLEAKAAEATERMNEIEARMSARPDNEITEDSAGNEFVKSESFKSMHEGRAGKATMVIKNTVVGSDVTVAPDRRGGIVSGANRILRLSDVIPQGATSSNAVEYTRENVFTNSATEVAEAGAKPESSITFTLESTPVRTIAHWIKLSRQVMDDAPMLASYIDGRMRYGVLLKYDQQLLTGNGTAPNLSGLMDTGNFTAFTAGAGDNEIESIRKAMTQVAAADYMPNAVVMNPADVQAIDLVKGTANDHFIAGDPASGIFSRIWGLPIVQTNAMTAGNFLLGAFDMASEAFARQGVTVELSESDDTNFTTNLVTLRAEMRAALAVYRPASIVGGALTA